MRAATRLPIASLLFAAVLILWSAGLAGLWTLSGVARWSVGLLYVLYDTWLIGFVALELKGRDSRHAARPGGLGAPAAPRLGVAVLIAARNESLALPVTLTALFAQDDPPDEVWVIDDGSDDETLAVLSSRFGLEAAPGAVLESATQPTLRVLSKANSGKADSLNRGIELTHCELIVTLDADTVPRSDAVGVMRRAFSADTALVAAGGVLTPRCGPGLSGGIFEWFQGFEYLRSFIARVAWMRVDALLLVSGAFACYRREALMAVGGLDPRSWVEDYELIHRLHRHARDRSLPWRIRVLPDAAAVTDAPGTLGAFMRQRRRWFGGFLQTLYRHRDMVGNPAYARLGQLMLPLKVIDTLQPLFGLTAFVLLIDFAWSRQAVLGPVFVVIGVKLIVDFAFLLWSIAYYRRWQGRVSRPRDWVSAGLAALTEPFFFQPMRHCGAMLGWFAVFKRRTDWLPQRAPTAAGTTRARYTGMAMFLHWAVALGLAINVGLAWSVDHIADAAVRPVIDAHKSIGITLLGLVLLRLLWRLSHAPPPPAARHAAWERRSAHAVHAAFYGLMLALPLSGWLHDSAWKSAATHPLRLFGLVDWPRIHAISTLDPVLKESLHTLFGQMHTAFAYVLYVLVVVHVAGALKHQLIDREPALERMLPRSNRVG